MESDIYPLTIISDRYNGTYSGAKFLAFNTDYWNIPLDVEGSDPDCQNFWFEYKDGETITQPEYFGKVYVGKGSTPNEAHIDLINKINSINTYKMSSNPTPRKIRVVSR